MIFKKDSFILGFIIGLIAPLGGFLIYRYTKFAPFSWRDVYDWLRLNPNLITVSISLSLLANAVLFTIYINAHIDKTAKGIFAATIIYALIALSIKTFA